MGFEGSECGDGEVCPGLFQIGLESSQETSFCLRIRPADLELQGVGWVTP